MSEATPIDLRVLVRQEVIAMLDRRQIDLDAPHDFETLFKPLGWRVDLSTPGWARLERRH